MEFLFRSVRNAEISFLIDTKYDVSLDLLEFCKKQRIILYFERNCLDNVELLEKTTSLGIDKVVLLDAFSLLDDNIAREIVAQELNVCFLNNGFSLDAIVVQYNQLVNKGFCRIVSVVNTSGSCEVFALPGGLINRAMIERFNIRQNLSIAANVEKLKQNAFKRHNRHNASKKPLACDVLLVNVNVNLLMGYERKNLGIEYLASVLNFEGIQSDCIYCSQISVVKDVMRAIDQRGVKIVGFSCMQDNVRVIEHVSQLLKNTYSGISVFVGGAQAVGLKEDFLKSSKADFIMVGESETNIASLIKHILYNNSCREDIRGIRYLDEHGLYQETLQVDLIENLDKIPFPDYVYKRDDNLFAAGIITGRGCPFNCAFCYEGAKEKNVRYRTLNNVFEEITLLLKNNKNVKLIQVYDDTFTLDEKRVLDFCDRFREIRKHKNVCWICEMHCQTVYDKPELIRYMVDSGLEQAQIGLESGDPEVLRRYKKCITPEMIERTVKNCKAAGLKMLEGNILLGGAGETRDQMEANTEFVKRLLKYGAGILSVQPVMYWPFVNTPIASNPEHYGVRIIDDQIDYTIQCIDNCVTETNSLSRQDIIEYADYLKLQIKDECRRIARQFTYEQAKMHWLSGAFSSYSQWGKTLAECKYMCNYFIAKENGSPSINEKNVFIMRTFNLLIYRENQLYIKESELLMDEVDSRILELCNGKNTIEDISGRLQLDIEIVTNRLSELDNKMLVYGVSC